MYKDKNFLIDHAYSNVWCGPGMDRQHTLSPTLITGTGGERWSVQVGMSTYTLPFTGKRWDVFVFGDLIPEYLGLMKNYDHWISANKHMSTQHMRIWLYNVHGVQFPLTKAFFMFTRTGNLVLALERTPNVPNFSIERLYVKFRSPAYNTVADTNLRPTIRYGYIEYSGPLEQPYLQFRQQWLDAVNSPRGYTIGLVNGYRVREFDPAKLNPGDHLEWIYNDDVKKAVEVKLSDLGSFDSTLDGKRKYLLLRDNLGDEIDFIDDVDFYILNYTRAAEYRGVLYHLNKADAARMVTHRDYSICSDYVHSALNQQGWSLLDDIRIEAVVRHSGYDRALVDEHHRIKELFKLSGQDRMDAMVGSETGVEVWKADHLENSQYLKLMRAPLGTITSGDVIDSYGYNAVSRLTGLVPIKVEPGQSFVKLTYGQYTAATVYEYDASGKMLGWYNHDIGIEYALRNPETRYIEAFAGSAGVGLSTAYNTHTLPERYKLESRRNYRFYKGAMTFSGDMGDWEDITGNTDYYTVIDGEVYWEELAAGVITAIRNDLDFLSKDIEIDTRDGVLMFSVGADEVFPGKASIYTLMDLPPGEVDIFLNGWDLVPEVDYYVNWPEICVVSSRYWTTEPKQRITIRARGFCKSDMSFDQPSDHGLVVHNQLSRNGRYNVRDDKVTRISVGGAIYTMDEVDFAEDGTFVHPIPNGTPYRITHPYVPMLDLVPGDSYSYRALSEVVDKEIEGYMDEHNPEPEIIGPIPVASRHVMVSPFCSKIIADMVAGIITMDGFMGNYSNQDVADRFRGYTYLLDYDPVLRETRTDIFVFRPHRNENVELDIYQFRLMYRIIETYLHSRIDLNRYATIIERVY